jgi:hypothetical protein
MATKSATAEKAVTKDNCQRLLMEIGSAPW